MDIVTIDPSQNCTAICINGDIHVIAKRDIVVTKSGNYTKWFEMVSEFCEIHVIDLDFNTVDYSELENRKFTAYLALVDIIKTILTVSGITNAVISIEGYSFSSASGKLIDLVTIGTLIRHTVLPFASELIIMSPPQLKLNSCVLTYPPVDVGIRKPKFVFQNLDGVKGGSFKKHEMCKAIIDNSDIITPWAGFLRSQSESILGAKNIPKPIDDINDAYLLYHIQKNRLVFDNI